MKTLLLALAFLIFTPLAAAQGTELACPSGYQVVQGPYTTTLNPSSGAKRINFCLDPATGHLFYQGDAGNSNFGANAVFATDAKYGMKWDAQITWGCTYTNGNPAITCPNATFTQADVGKAVWATNVSESGFGSAVTSTTTIPQGTITVVTDSTHITVSNAPTANSTAGSASVRYGTEEGAALNLAWHDAADKCGTLILPAGRTVSARGQFNYYNPKCIGPTVSISGQDKRGQGVIGQGTQATSILIPPGFDFTTGASPASCDGGSSGGCFLSVKDQMYASGFTIDGGGLNISAGGGSTTTLLKVNCDNCNFHDLNFTSFQAGQSASVGNFVIGAFNIWDHVQSDGWGGNACEFGSSAVVSPPTGNPMRVSNSYCGDSATTALTVLQGMVFSTNSYYQCATSSCDTIKFLSTVSDFHSTNDQIYCGGTTVSNGRCLIGNSGTNAWRATIENANIINVSAGGFAVVAFGGGSVHLSNSRISAPSGTAIDIFDTTSSIYLNDGNFIAGTTLINNQGPGILGGTSTIVGSGTGTATASATLGPIGLSQFATPTFTSTTIDAGVPMKTAGTILGISVSAGTGGVNASSGVVTVRKNGSNTSITCTLGTGTFCQDFAHATANVAGDIISASVTTQAGETLANIKVTVVTGAQ